MTARTDYQDHTRDGLLVVIRNLQWKLKTLAKQCGKQGETIYRLRCENAALREAVKFDPGDRARLFAQLRTAEVENRRLREKLAAADEPVPYVPVDDNLYAQTPAQAKAVEDFVNNGTTSPEAARAYSGVATDDGAFGRKA